jgi:hypothetical protein
MGEQLSGVTVWRLLSEDARGPWQGRFAEGLQSAQVRYDDVAVERPSPSPPRSGGERSPKKVV